MLLPILLFLSVPSFASTSETAPARPFGRGTAWTYADTNDKGDVTRVGVLVSEAALEGLPPVDLELVLRLPPAAPFRSVLLRWNAHGHEPMQLYGVPHFDFHFYLIPESVRTQILCTGADAAICKKMPDPRNIPPHYAPAPDGMKQMGWHWVDREAPEVNGKPFFSTFIYGYYAGKPAFLEPMITREFLLRRSRFSATVPQPVSFMPEGRTPRSYTVEYDAGVRAYKVTLLW